MYGAGNRSLERSAESRIAASELINLVIRRPHRGQEMILPAGTTLTLLASYCGDNEYDDCTDKLPCKECLAMCNQYMLLHRAEAEYVGEVEYMGEVEQGE